MVYNKVGQIRQNPDQSVNFNLAQNSYFSPVSYSNIIIQTQSPYDDTKKFNDFGLSIYEEIDNTRRQITFDKQNTYYIRVIIKKAFDDYNIEENKDNNQLSYKLKLLRIDSNNNRKYQQLLSTFVVNAAVEDNSSSYTYDLIFKPNASYDQLLFELEKNSYDYLRWTNQDEGWRNWLNQLGNIKIDSFVILKNIINKTFSKIGFQSRPGEQIAINGYPIRVGKSGIYELDNKTPITSVMIAPNAQNQIDAFLLDYMYSESDEEDE